ncbi:hypothetical protein GCM10023178_01400 [Actinomadura luteofluorescens]
MRRRHSDWLVTGDLDPGPVGRAAPKRGGAQLTEDNKLALNLRCTTRSVAQQAKEILIGLPETQAATPERRSRQPLTDWDDPLSVLVNAVSDSYRCGACPRAC